MYSDADHGSNPDNSRSTSAYVVKMGPGAVCWMSRLQSIVALSTTEAEFISAVSAGQEIVWMRSFAGKLGYSFDAPSLCSWTTSRPSRLRATLNTTGA
jgi:hypothetical protein